MKFTNNRPLYLQVKDDILKRIDLGEWEEEDKILTENEFADYYQTSRVTIRHALSELESDGVIERFPGRGTIVSRERIKPEALKLISFTDLMKEKGKSASTTIIDIDYQRPPSAVRKGLNLEDNEKIWRVRRLRIADDNPFAIHDLFIPPDVKVSTRDIQQMESYYTFIREQYGLEPSYANERLTATTANEIESDLLNVPVGDPLLFIWRTTFSELHKPIEVVKILIIAKKFEYELKLFA